MTTIRPRMPGGGARRVLAALVVPAIAGAVALTATAPALPASAVSAAEAPPLRLRALDVHDRLAGSKAFRMSDYSNAWVSAAGEYVLSNDAGFNPNVGSTVDWRLLRPS